MERTTRKQVEGTFARFAETSGIPGLILCHETGGYIVRQEFEGSSGQSDVFGSRLRPAGEMWSTLHFAIQVATHTHAVADARTHAPA